MLLLRDKQDEQLRWGGIYVVALRRKVQELGRFEMQCRCWLASSDEAPDGCVDQVILAGGDGSLDEFVDTTKEKGEALGCAAPHDTGGEGALVVVRRRTGR